LIVEDSNLAPDGRTFRSVGREAAATLLTYKNLAGTALFFIVIGFALQMLATWWEVLYPKVS
jgi:hypothetical protein